MRCAAPVNGSQPATATATADAATANALRRRQLAVTTHGRPPDRPDGQCQPQRPHRQQRAAQPHQGRERAPSERAQGRRGHGEKTHRCRHASEQPVRRDRLPQRQVVDAEQHAAEIEREHRDAQRQRRQRDPAGDQPECLPRNRGEQQAVDQRRPDAQPGREPLRGRRRDHATEATQCVGDADGPRRKAEFAGGEQDQHRKLHVVEQLPQPGEPRECEQGPVVADQYQPLGDLGHHRLARAIVRDVAGRAHPPQQQRRDEEGQRVDGDRKRRGQHLDQRAGQPRADQRRRRLAQRDLRVRLDQPAAPRHLREQHLVGGPADDVLHTTQEPHHVEHLDRQQVGVRGDGQQQQRHAAPEIGEDHDGQLAHAVEQHTRVQRDQCERQRLQRHQHPHLERRCLQQHGRRQRQREVGDLRAERRDGHRCPQAQEVRLPPKATKKPPQLSRDAGHDRTC
jgi:hypothetical protein